MLHMQQQGKLSELDAKFYTAEICLALNFLHTGGIIYRDLKLDNVLLDYDGHIKLTDYGMCKDRMKIGDTTSTFCGTPNYIAPEVLRGENYSFSVDWWALGILLYEMLVGKSPFYNGPEGKDNEDDLFEVILKENISIPDFISDAARLFLIGLLEKNPAKRLGCQQEYCFKQIKSHDFFEFIDWEKLEQKEIPAPFLPNREETKQHIFNQSPELINQKVQLIPDDAHFASKIDQSEFEGFDFININSNLKSPRKS